MSTTKETPTDNTGVCLYIATNMVRSRWGKATLFFLVQQETILETLNFFYKGGKGHVVIKTITCLKEKALQRGGGTQLWCKFCFSKLGNLHLI